MTPLREKKNKKQRNVKRNKNTSAGQAKDDRDGFVSNRQSEEEIRNFVDT